MIWALEAVAFDAHFFEVRPTVIWALEAVAIPHPRSNNRVETCHWASVVRNIWFLCPLFPSKREKNVQTETT